MLAAGPRQTLLAALSLLFLGCGHFTRAAPGDVGPVAITPVETDFCEEPVQLEPGLRSVHCISPAIRMNPGQVQLLHQIVSNTHSSHQDKYTEETADAELVVHVSMQVININLLYPNPFPADQTVAIVNQSAQLIHVADRQPVTPNEVSTYAFKSFPNTSNSEAS